MKTLAVFLIRFYQKRISPKRPGKCPSTPSCSRYALESFQEYGFRAGLGMTLERLRICGREDREPRVFTLRSYVAFACGMFLTLFWPEPTAESLMDKECCEIDFDCCSWN